MSNCLWPLLQIMPTGDLGLQANIRFGRDFAFR
jgi:hypothetical protein